jgi:hypothetical protein
LSRLHQRIPTLLESCILLISVTINWQSTYIVLMYWRGKGFSYHYLYCVVISSIYTIFRKRTGERILLVLSPAVSSVYVGSNVLPPKNLESISSSIFTADLSHLFLQSTTYFHCACACFMVLFIGAKLSRGPYLGICQDT